MIDPNNITNYARTYEELLEFWLFCLFVRGKNADTQARKLGDFLKNIYKVRNLEGMMLYNIHAELVVVKAGQYNTLSSAIFETMRELEEDSYFLRNATCADLESLPGVGPKTSRFFILHSRKNARHAVLDTHILKYLKQTCSAMEVPKTTPTGMKYRLLEEAFLSHADILGIDVAAFDLALWRASRESHVSDWPKFIGDRHE